MRAVWQKEKEKIERVRKIKQELDALRLQLQGAERELRRLGQGRRDPARPHSRFRLKELERETKSLSASKKGRKMLKEEVDSEDIAEVVPSGPASR